MKIQVIEDLETKKQFLKRYRKSIARLARLREKLKLLDTRITSMRSSNLSGMPRGGIPVTLDDLLADKEELEERINELKKKSKSLRREILSKIDSLEDDRYSEILEAHFIDGLPIEKVSEKIGYSERHTYNLYKEALIKISI